MVFSLLKRLTFSRLKLKLGMRALLVFFATPP